MREAVSIITPAYRANAHIARAVKSALSQTYADWEMLIVADDRENYADVLARQGIVDERLVFLTTGKTGAGASVARNVALNNAQHRFGAILDADDYWRSEKLERTVHKAQEVGIVSTALEIVDKDLHTLRTIGVGPNRNLPIADYKFTNFSMDSMLVYDRQRCDARYDESFPHLTDIDFLLKLFAASSQCHHIGVPLHVYVKEPQAMSNAPGASQRLGATKQRLMALLEAGHYALQDQAGLAGLLDFYKKSLAAEEAFLPLYAQDHTILFEDHLEKFLASGR